MQDPIITPNPGFLSRLPKPSLRQRRLIAMTSAAAIVVVGLGDRFQIWERDAFQAHRAAQRELAREGLAQLRGAQRAQRSGLAG